MILPAEISRQAFRLGLGDKTIEKDYILTWVLLGIANSSLMDRLAFKGGTAIKKIYDAEYRFSEDLDFTVIDDISNDELFAEIEALFPWLQREVNITLAVRKTEVHKTGNPAIYLNYIGPLRGDLASRFLKMDFTHNELLLFPLGKAPLQTSYSDCLKRDEILLVYSLEEIMAEKLCALLGRTEPRDLFDIHYLLTQRELDLASVSFRLEEKMIFKELATADLKEVLERKQGSLSRLWEPRLRGQLLDELPHIEAVIRETNQLLRREGII